MSPMSRTNKILTAVVAIALLAAVAVLIFTYLPKGGPSTPQGQYITITMDKVSKTYTLSDLKALTSISGHGGYRTNAGMIKDTGNYTGVPIKVLLFSFNNITRNVTLSITAGDMSESYNMSMQQGLVPIYNASHPENSTPIRVGGVIMALIYEYNGQPLNSTDGNFEIGFLTPPMAPARYTAGSYWLYDVRSIQVIPT